MIQDTENSNRTSVVFHFINSSVNHKSKRVDFQDYEDIISWCRQQKMIKKSEERFLVSLSELHPDKGDDSFRKMMDCRRLLYQLFSDIARGVEPNKISQEKFNRLLREVFISIRMEFANTAARIQFIDAHDTDHPFRRIIKYAFEIITHDYSTMRQCPRCQSIFIDTTKNKSKKWCDSFSCGSQDKASRFYHRTKASRESRPRS